MDTKQANSVMFCCLVKGEPEIQGQEPGENVTALIWKRWGCTQVALLRAAIAD